MLVFSGGTGTPKLLSGLKELLSPDDLSVVVNTAEDLWISGNFVSPDVDTVLYTLADLIDDQRWWGIRGDSFIAHEFLLKIGGDEALSLGDRDRAVHIFRSNLLRRGYSLSCATERLCEALGVRQRVVPMSDNPISTMIDTPEGEFHFQDFWVSMRGTPEVISIRLKGIDEALPSPGFLELLEREETVLIGPSNPVTSIGPILSLPGVRERLKDKTVVAISPLIGDKPVGGPAAKFMRACKVPANDDGVKSLLQKADLFVVDLTSSYSGKCIRLDTLMKTKEDSLRLARSIIELI